MVDDAATPPQPTSASADDVAPAESVPNPEPVETTPPKATKKVVSLVDAAASKAASQPSAGATAPDAGAGEAASSGAAKPAKKPEKEIDWGKFNHLVENFTLIYPTDTVWDGAKRKIVKIGNLAHAFSSDYVRMWKASINRKQVDDHEVVFDPTESCPAHYVNLFDGIAMEPKKGEVLPIIELVRYLTSRASEDAQEADDVMHWLLQWLAYPLQHVGAKLRTSVVMHGDEGAGKNFLFDLVASIYGKYGVLVGQDELEDKFNDWRSCKLFVVGDEVSSRQELVHNKNRLKALITSATVQINPKNLPRREEANHMNVVFLSNEITPLALDNSDRRYLVIYTPRAKDFEFYRKLGKWRDNGGTEAFYQFLLEYPLEGFDPYAPAPQTVAKRDLIDINRKSPELFWLAWKAGEIDLPYWPCSTSQAYRAYTKWCQRIGDRFPFKQNLFTRNLLRISEGEGYPLREKVMSPKDELGTYKAIRMLLTLPEQPPEGQPAGVWAGDSRDAFEKELNRYVYGGFPPSPTDGSTGGEQ
jgi:putative DNA primase/helicase